MRRLGKIGCAALALGIAPAANADILVRPHIGNGVMEGHAYQHAGARLLLDASSDKKYGFEYSRVHMAQGDYIAAGIVLEKKQSGWFNMSIGTISYFGQGQGSQNYPGVVANLGWEPESTNGFRPFVTLRNDILFADRTYTGTSLSVGASFDF